MSGPIDLLGERARRSPPVAYYSLALRVARDGEATVWDWTSEQSGPAEADTPETARGLVLALREAADELEERYGLRVHDATVPAEEGR